MKKNEEEITPKSRLSKKKGLPSGSLYATSDTTYSPSITIRRFHDQTIDISTNTKYTLVDLSQDGFFWLDISGSLSMDDIKAIGENFQLHTLTLEDILNTQQRPKIEDYDAYTYISCNALLLPKNRIIKQQVAILFHNNWILTFTENQGESPWQELYSRFQAEQSKLDIYGVQYLLYCLFDTVIDHYFAVIDYLEDRIERTEERVFTDQQFKAKELFMQRRMLILTRRTINPMREIMSRLRSLPSNERDRLHIYFNDLTDHLFRALESVEAMHDILTTIHDSYLSQINNRMNSIMKVLAIISTIFNPLMFLVGVYGMNFDFMPETHLRYGYPLIWGFMVVLVIIMLYLFKRNKWL